MTEEPLLAGLVVVGRDHEHRVGARLVGEAGQLDGLQGGIGARAGHDGHASARRRDDRAHDVHVLLVRKRGRLARGADRHQPVDPAPDLVFDEFPQLVIGNPAAVKRRDHGGEGAGERSELLHEKWN